MDTVHAFEEAGTIQAPGSPHDPLNTAAALLGSAVLTSSLPGCGGGKGQMTQEDAARFLAQASTGSSRTQINHLMSIGFSAWLDEQFAMPQTASRCDWLISKGYDAAGTNDANKNGLTGFDACVWRKLIASPDALRQRVTLALSEILVVSVAGLSGGWRAFSGAHYLDILETHAFGNYRTLLEHVSTSPAMGEYLTYRGNVKYNAKTGALPDENYARELMQLFTIGLIKLNLDGSPTLDNGKPQETYGLTDITNLARIFTGWVWDKSVGNGDTPDFQRRPMIQVATRHETGSSTFLGSTVPAGLDGAASLKAALDIIFAHPNVAPFVSKQLIQRLVTSNPSTAYVARVAAVFNNDGQGVKGNLQAVIKAILLDDEARDANNITSDTFGKLREPVVRFLNWATAFGATSPSDAWAIGDTSDPGTKLGQSPLRSPSVFNFFRPGYVPPGSGIAQASLVAPEFQLSNESSVAGYINFMQGVISNGIGDVKADYTVYISLADSADQLVDELHTLLLAGQMGASNLGKLKAAIGSMPSGTPGSRANRVYAAVLLLMAAPEFLIQK